MQKVTKQRSLINFSNKNKFVDLARDGLGKDFLVFLQAI